MSEPFDKVSEVSDKCLWRRWEGLRSLEPQLENTLTVSSAVTGVFWKFPPYLCNRFTGSLKEWVDDWINWWMEEWINDWMVLNQMEWPSDQREGTNEAVREWVSDEKALPEMLVHLKMRQAGLSGFNTHPAERQSSPYTLYFQLCWTKKSMESRAMILKLYNIYIFLIRGEYWNYYTFGFGGLLLPGTSRSWGLYTSLELLANYKHQLLIT